MAPFKTKTFKGGVSTFLAEEYYRILVWWKLYGAKSILLHLFGCSNTWCMVSRLLSVYKKKPLEDVKDMFKDFKDLQTSECNAIAVSGTLVATIGIGSMALPSANQAHWTARAFWILSLVSGLISVQHACNLQCILTKNLSWDQLWGWLNDEREREVKSTKKNQRKGAQYEAKSAERDEEKGIRYNCMPLAKAKWKDTKCESSLEEHYEEKSYFHIPDFFAVLLISAPRMMLHYSLLAYTVGLGIYLGFVWKEQLVAEAFMGDNENIFIFFLASVAVCYPMYWMYFVANLCKNDVYQRDWVQLRQAKQVGITEAWRDQVINRAKSVEKTQRREEGRQRDPEPSREMLTTRVAKG